ncbi:glycerol-3-phosphate dehydrogenase/oxidase [Cytobacillus sp. FSL K6-0265]|uniref:glycerol-3-phosphate dehydrogenase/oxidase n=1 Tax=Cytobacillus sp. FSL K6-0265 TaxID=2921448 RepID=UPI0030FAE31D
MTFSAKNRSTTIHDLTNNEYDLVVIGGGITGAGIALDAVTRGMKVALIEMQDFAAGTSSRSTKLVHGGLRYLKQFECHVVSEVGKERAIVYENGPHITKPEWMVLPFYQEGTFGKFTTSIGLRVYDFLAGVKRDERRTMLNKEQVLSKEPLLKEEGLLGGGYYVEYRTDDARLTIEVIKEAAHRGADVINYAKVTDFIYRDGMINGVEVQDQLSNESYQVFGKKCVNATGPWVERLLDKDAQMENKSLKLTKGVHIVIDHSIFPLAQAIYFDSEDGRMIFAIPREGKTYVGTTDTFYKDDPAHPSITDEDRLYLLNAIKGVFPNVKVTEADIESSWAGVRPLIHEEGKSPSEISRRDEIWVSAHGLISIAGGKLTGYRKMAETIVDRVSSMLKKEYQLLFSKSMTKHLPLSGGRVGGAKNFPTFIEAKKQEGIEVGLKGEESLYLLSRYGSNAPVLFSLVKQYHKDEHLMPRVLWLELKYALDYEMAVSPVDFFFRRTGALLFNIMLVFTYKNAVIEMMAEELDWTVEQTLSYTNELNEVIEWATNKG